MPHKPPVLHADDPPLVPYVATGITMRDRVAQWIYMRSAEPGITNAEIARRLGIAPHTLSTYLSRARKEGWLQIEDPLTKVEVEIMPKIVENVNYFLDARDRNVTIEAMKGFLVPQYKESKGILEDKPLILGIKIEMPEGPNTVKSSGQISGIPRTLDVQVLKDDD